ncbi:MAG: tetratricopeptide repeat protein [Chloroflexi bacterium]|nr:tetratricopeptide repeat protein [Chloroflexota bacterium]
MELTIFSTQEVPGQFAAAEPHLQQINGLIEQANDLRESNPQRSLAMAQEALRLVQKIKLVERLLTCYVTLGATYSYLSDHEQAIACSLKAVQLSQERDDKTHLFHSLNQVGVSYAHMGLYPEGLTYLLQAQAVAEEFGSVNNRTAAANNIGWLYLKLGWFDEARRCFEAALPLVMAHDNKQREADFHDNLSQVYQGLGQLETALQHGEQSVATYHQLGSVRGEAEAWTTLGQLHFRQAHHEQAILCLQNAPRLFHQVDNPQGIVTAQLVMGQVYEQQGQLVLALTHLHEVLALAEVLNIQREQYECHEALSRIYQTTGDLALALHHYQQFHGVKENLFNEQADSRLKSLEVRSRVEQSQQEALALQREIEEHERHIADLDAFAHTVAHDLKSPLGIIAGYSELLLEDYEVLDAAARQSILQTIGKTTRKMVRIVDDLLTLAQVQRQVITPEPLNMGYIWQDVVARLQQEIETSQATLHQPDTWPVALGHASWVEEVWANYLSNALKYGGQPPIIKVGATPLENNEIRFWMQDNGAGLDSEAQAKLFQDFSRLNTQQSKGHGLGLSIVKRIVERLGNSGRNECAWAGSTFSFTLPFIADGSNS